MTQKGGIMNIKIRNKWSNKVIISGKYESIKDCLERNRGAHLQGANLQGADLWGAHLQGANLQGAYLRGANLQGANLQGAHLQGAYLRGADLWGANLRGADLWGAHLQGANLQGAHLQGAKNYYMSHDFVIEIIRRQDIKFFTPKEWQIIGQIVVHRLCWETIKKEYAKKIMPIFKKLAKFGFDEYLGKYKEILEEK